MPKQTRAFRPAPNTRQINIRSKVFSGPIIQHSPGRSTHTTITALKGTPSDLVPHAATKIVVTTESPEGGTQDVYFNRGVAASQEYVRRFGDKTPENAANNQAFIWLSRGLYEAMVAFVDSAQPGKHALRVAAYEFQYEPFLQVLKRAIDRGVDTRIIYDARQENPRDPNRQAVANVGLQAVCKERRANPSAISPTSSS